MIDEKAKASALKRQRRMKFLYERVCELHKTNKYAGANARRQANIDWAKQL